MSTQTWRKLRKAWNDGRRFRIRSFEIASTVAVLFSIFSAIPRMLGLIDAKTFDGIAVVSVRMVGVVVVPLWGIHFFTKLKHRKDSPFPEIEEADLKA